MISHVGPRPLVELRTLLAVTVDDVRATAGRWLAAEPDDDIRAELRRLLDGPADELAARFGGRLMFGTAGLRAAVGAGPLRMNRLVVRQAARGLADYLLAIDPRGRRAWRRRRLRRPPQERRLRPRHRPRDRRRRRARAPAARTAADARARLVGHRARRGRRGDGHGVAQPAGRQRLQGVPRRRRPDRAAPRRARSPSASPPSTRPRSRWPPPTTIASSGSAASIVDRYVASMRSVRLRPATTGVLVAYTPMHGVGGELVAAGVRRRRPARAGRRRRAVPARPDVPDGVVPEPGGAGGDGPRDRAGRRAGRRARPRQRSRRRPPRRGDPAAGRVVAAPRRRRDRVAARRPHPDQHRRATTASS